MGPTHAAAGAFTAAIITGFNPTAMAVGAVTALLPDIDEPNSMISRRIPIIPHIIGGIFGHRTITHSLLGLVFFALPVFVFWKEYFLVFIIGYLSHLLLDSFTKTGVPLGYPLIKKYYGPKLIRTGGIVEVFFIIFLVTVFVGLQQLK